MAAACLFSGGFDPINLIGWNLAKESLGGLGPKGCLERPDEGRPAGKRRSGFSYFFEDNYGQTPVKEKNRRGEW